ncbi:MAG: hypothetical protein R2856_07270 [Caldilineaceae bacterium]
MPPPVPQEDAAAAPASAETAHGGSHRSGRQLAGSISLMGMELEIIVDFVRKGNADRCHRYSAAGARWIFTRTTSLRSTRRLLCHARRAARGPSSGDAGSGVISGVFRQSGVEGSFTLTQLLRQQEAATPARMKSTPIRRASSPSLYPPTHWILETFDTYAMLTAPDGDLTVT